jgi:hypothetical protein
MLAAMPRLVLTLTFGQPQPAAGSDPVLALQACDLLVTEGKPTTAIPCFEGIRLQFPGTTQAHDAERALSLLRALPPPAPLPALTPPVSSATAPAAPAPGKDSFYVLEPYSTRTRERLRLTTWEKLDFGITAFIYGLSTGAAFGGATNADNVIGSMVVGSLLYTGLSLVYVNTAQVDRGDLPLTLAISSYVPLTAGLITLSTGNINGRAGAAVVAVSGLLALPAAYWAGAVTDLDPGDTQLVRDAGFWGAVWGVTTALASSEWPSDRTVGIAGMLGLYGGLGLGLLAANTTDISLERVRVTTWGGYGGAIIGVLVAAANESSAREAYGFFAGGSALGVILTFALTASIDAPPVNATFGPRPVSLRYLEPALLPLVDREGRTRAHPGVSLLRGRF